MRASESAPSTPRAKERTMRPPSCLADLPIPTPPPMANLFVTSRFDFPTRGGYSFRRLLNSSSSEFGRPSTMGRSGSFDAPHSLNLGESRERLAERETYGSLYRRHDFSEQSRPCGGTPVLNRRNFYCPDYFTNHPVVHQDTPPEYRKEKRRKYISTNSDLSRELEEVQKLSQELHRNYVEYHELEEETDSGVPENTPTPQQNPYYNDHYISDIDENEEVKRFCVSYDVSDPKSFSGSEKCGYTSRTLPPTPSVKFSKSGHVPSPQSGPRSDGFRGSLSSLKSSDFGGGSPSSRKVPDASHSQRIIKTPMRPVVKIARIR